MSLSLSAMRRATEAANPTRSGRRAVGPGRHFTAPEWEWTKHDDVGWWVRPGWRTALIGPAGLRLDEWHRAGRLTTVKSGPHRVVYRAELAEGTVYIKHFLVPNRRAVLRQWFRRGKGRNEAKQAARLAGSGVATITPIALGERRLRGFLTDNYLITIAIPNAVPLDEFLDGLGDAGTSATRRQLAEALGELTARLHDGGFLHNDFHPGNVLVRRDAAGPPRLVMIDLDALRSRRRAIDRKDAVANLAHVNHAFCLRTSRSERLRFVRTYLATRRSPIERPEDLPREIEEQSRLWAERLWCRAGKRCLGDNKYFATYRSSRCWAVAARDVAPETVRALLRNPDAPFSWPGARPLKDSRTTTVAEVRLPGGPEGDWPVIYKRFNRKKFLDPIYTLFRPSRAWRAWRNGQHLVSRGVPTPRNLIVIGRTAVSRRLLPHQYWPHDTYLVTLKADPAITLYEFVAARLPGLSEPARRRWVRRAAPALARLIRLLHVRSLSHRDLKSANILIEGDPLGDEPRLSLIDLVGVKLEPPITRHHQVQNLARLHLSLGRATGRTRTDALRFLKTYLPCGELKRSDWKALWREIGAAGDRKVGQNLRNNRKLS